MWMTATYLDPTLWSSVLAKAGLPWRLRGRELPCQCRRHGFNPCVGKIPWRRKYNPLQYSCPGNPMDRENWRATVQGVTKSQHDWVTNTWLQFPYRGARCYSSNGKSFRKQSPVTDLNKPKISNMFAKLTFHLMSCFKFHLKDDCLWLPMSLYAMHDLSSSNSTQWKSNINILSNSWHY